MKKEFLDYLYEERSSVQEEINLLVELSKNPKDGKCKDCQDPIKKVLEAKRMHIYSINKII